MTFKKIIKKKKNIRTLSIYLTLFFVNFSILFAGPKIIKNRLTKENLNLIYETKVGGIESRIRAIKTCGSQRMYFCLRALTENLEDENSEIRRVSAQNIGTLRIYDAFNALESALKKENETKVKKTIIMAIGYLNKPNTSNAIEPYLRDKEDEIRETTAKSLALLNDEKSLGALRQAYKAENNELVKVNILSTILIIDSTDYKERAELLKYLNNSNRWIRYNAAQTLQTVRFVEAVNTLEKALNLEDEIIVRKELYRAYINVINAF
ncbi:MAG: HEAT repeat domain-containing protein [Spirochaetia bacterium]|nr:HEAT repeat domain-containing protein [Spirochaetia bacterium]